MLPNCYVLGVQPRLWHHLLHRANLSRRAGGTDPAAEAALDAGWRCAQRLAVYGTLAPGERNHHELASCRGRWRRGTVRGHLTRREYPELRPAADAPSVAVQVLDSRDLPAHWAALDAFEGDGYQRLLVVVQLATGPTLANLYAAAPRRRRSGAR